jgi:uncharacterized pyridoxal phosphate-containing UPF0001 family protein
VKVARLRIQVLVDAREPLHLLSDLIPELIDALIELNLSGEDSKGGFTLSELLPEAERLALLSGIRVRGVMTMASFTATESELHRSFAEAREARAMLVEAGHPAEELSMGMSNDYEIAVEEGATMVRLGTTLFGARAK